MRRLFFCLAILLTIAARPVAAADGKVIKALPLFLDKQGQTSVSPSLFERDAYQAWLRKHPTDRTGLSLAVQWKASGVDWSKLKLRAELRGVVGNSTTNVTLELPVKKTGLFSTWTYLKLDGDNFQKLGEMAAWRVTLWEGDKLLAELQSFLWSGVEKG